MHIEPEDDLIEACVRRDEAAWSRFVAKYSPLIRGAAAKCLRRCAFEVPLHEVEDIHQEVLASVWKEERLSRLKDRSSVAPWLAIVTVNTAINYIKRMGLDTPAGPSSFFGRARRAEFSDTMPSPAEDSGEELLKSEFRGRLAGAVERLPHKEKLIMKLLLHHGKKYREIADMLAMPKGTVSNYVKRARERLRKDIKKYV